MVYINTNNFYTHYNRSMDKFIKNKAHYEEELKRGGYVPIEESNDKADTWREKNIKPYKANRKVHEIMQAVKSVANKNGNVTMPEKCIDELKSMGMTFDADKIAKTNEAIGKGYFL